MKNTSQRILCILLVICLLTASSAAFAKVEWTRIDALGAGLTIGVLGYSTCSSYIELTNSTDTGTLYMNLQKYVNGYWTNVYTWSTSGTDNFSLVQNYYVTSGYYYRVHVIAYVYSSGTLMETATQDSNSVFY